MISTFLTSKPSGALSIMNIIRPNVCMPITSRILEGNLIFSDMIQSYVKIGKVGLSLHAILKGARGWNSAPTAMVGKNNNFIP